MERDRLSTDRLQVFKINSQTLDMRKDTTFDAELDQEAQAAEFKRQDTDKEAAGPSSILNIGALGRAARVPLPGARQLTPARAQRRLPRLPYSLPSALRAPAAAADKCRRRLRIRRCPQPTAAPHPRQPPPLPPPPAGCPCLPPPLPPALPSLPPPSETAAPSPASTLSAERRLPPAAPPSAASQPSGRSSARPRPGTRPRPRRPWQWPPMPRPARPRAGQVDAPPPSPPCPPGPPSSLLAQPWPSQSPGQRAVRRPPTIRARRPRGSSRGRGTQHLSPANPEGRDRLT